VPLWPLTPATLKISLALHCCHVTTCRTKSKTKNAQLILQCSSVQFSFQFSLKTSLCQLCNSLPSTTGSKHIELNTHKGYHALPQAQEYLPLVSSLPWCLCFRRQHTTYIHTLNQKTGKLNKHKFASCGATYYHFTFRLQKHATEDQIIQSQSQVVLLLHGSTSTCTSGVAGGHVALHGIAALSDQIHCPQMHHAYITPKQNLAHSHSIPLKEGRINPLR